MKVHQPITLIIALLILAGCATSPEPPPSNKPIAERVYQLLVLLKSDLNAQAANTGPPFGESPAAQPLHKSLNKINSSIGWKFAFYTKDFFLVDSRASGSSYGCETNRVYRRENQEEYGEGMAWVLPVGTEKRSAALFIISKISPKQTTVILIDDKFKARLLYDSFNKPEATLKSFDSGIDYLCGVQVVGHNHFLLHEGWMPGMSQASLWPRTFTLKVTPDNGITITPGSRL